MCPSQWWSWHPGQFHKGWEELLQKCSDPKRKHRERWDFSSQPSLKRHPGSLRNQLQGRTGSVITHSALCSRKPEFSSQSHVAGQDWNSNSRGSGFLRLLHVYRAQKLPKANTCNINKIKLTKKETSLLVSREGPCVHCPTEHLEWLLFTPRAHMLSQFACIHGFHFTAGNSGMQR